ncbi:hypothetical protein [Bacillus sp. Marseille-P3661]|uniref:hypothetical protein n=1 Tax=Bacillus sp. Marseille-P3661 TaxID=1936234 RepID=UPI0015E19D66|nr:hypothetical protein [Bacillus sp. Marseille-P3661]
MNQHKREKEKDQYSDKRTSNPIEDYNNEMGFAEELSDGGERNEFAELQSNQS